MWRFFGLKQRYFLIQISTSILCGLSRVHIVWWKCHSFIKKFLNGLTGEACVIQNCCPTFEISELFPLSCLYAQRPADGAIVKIIIMVATQKKIPPCRLHLRTLRFVLRVTFTHIARLYRNLHWINTATIVKYLAGAYFMQKFQIARGEIWFSIKKYANVPIVSPRLEVRQISGRSKSILEADHDKVDVWVAVSHLWSRLYLSDQQEKYK